jgi:hypothetical protein
MSVRPIPIDVHPSTFAALPKLTLQAGLANVLPGVHHPEEDSTMQDQPFKGRVKAKSWKGRRKAGLRIRTDGSVFLG